MTTTRAGSGCPTLPRAKSAGSSRSCGFRRGAGRPTWPRSDLELDDAATGSALHAEAAAQATLTADASLLALPATQAAAEGARAEMADLAQQAARMQEEGRRADAQAQVQRMQAVAAAAPPQQAAALMNTAGEYANDVSSIQGAGGAASKALKQKAFDAVRAPVAGW